MKKISVIILFLLGGTYLQAQQKTFKAGASEIDITPMLEVEIVGNFDVPSASHIHDALYSKALVLDDGTTQIAIVIVDNVHVNEVTFDKAKQYLTQETGLSKENILMASTHTHSGPSTGDKFLEEGEPLNSYSEYLAVKIADGVKSAINNLEPAKIGWGGVDVPDHLFVRRWFMKDSVYSPYGTKDIVKMNPGNNPNIVKPSGPIDPEVSFISVQSASGRPLAVLANYSLHYVGWVPKGHISADYFALFGTYLGELMKVDSGFPRFVGMMSNGTSGNVNNNDYGSPRGELNSMDRPYEQMEFVAKDLAEKVHKAMKKITYQSWVPLGAELSYLTLEVLRASPEILYNIGKVLSRPESDEPLYDRRERIYAHRILKQQLEWPDQVEVPLQALRIGDLGITALPFETFTQTGLELKEKNPFGDSFTIELANGSFGYLPTPQEIEWGGYETWITVRNVEDNATIKITAELLKQLEKLKNDK